MLGWTSRQPSVPFKHRPDYPGGDARASPSAFRCGSIPWIRKDTRRAGRCFVRDTEDAGDNAGYELRVSFRFVGHVISRTHGGRDRKAVNLMVLQGRSTQYASGSSHYLCFFSDLRFQTSLVSAVDVVSICEQQDCGRLVT